MGDCDEEISRFTFGNVGFSVFPSMKSLVVVDDVFIPECLRKMEDGSDSSEKTLDNIVVEGDAIVPIIHTFFLEDAEKPFPSLEDLSGKEMTPLEEWLLDVLREIVNGGNPNLELWPLKNPSSAGDVPAFKRDVRTCPPEIPKDIIPWLRMIKNLSSQ